MHSAAKGRRADFLGGALLLVIGGGAVLRGASYRIGTLERMGPGFFPVALGALLALVGLALVAGAAMARPDEARSSPPPEWRGWICISLGVVAFVVLGRHGGLLPASFAVTTIAALGDRSNSLRDAVLLGAGVTAVAAVIFWWALQLQLPLFQWE